MKPEPKPKTDYRTILIIILLVPIFALAGVVMFKDALLSITGTKTEGIITNVEYIPRSSRRVNNLTIEYAFTDVNNVTYTNSDVYTNRTTPHFDIGQKITVAYDRNDARTSAIVFGFMYVKLFFQVVFVGIIIAILYGVLGKRKV
jgi:hypothetical protein